jgi:hypothetical protein
LNNSFVQKQAELLVERVKPAGDTEAQVRKAFEIVYQRVPTPEELAASLEFVKLPDSSFRSFCWALLSSNEFLYLD